MVFKASVTILFIYWFIQLFPFVDENVDEQVDGNSNVESRIVANVPSTSTTSTEKNEFAKLMTSVQSKVNALSNHGYSDDFDMQWLRDIDQHMEEKVDSMGITETASMYGKRYTKPVSNRMEVQMAFRPKKKAKKN